jgi:hypothetical protein
MRQTSLLKMHNKGQPDGRAACPGLVDGHQTESARGVTQRHEDFVTLAGLTIRTGSQRVIGVQFFKRCWPA